MMEPPASDFDICIYGSDSRMKTNKKEMHLLEFFPSLQMHIRNHSGVGAPTNVHERRNIGVALVVGNPS
jgi:hypothetical protein